MPKAAADAMAPMRAVWIALHHGLTPVNLPLTKPKISKATRVNNTDTLKALSTLEMSMYGNKGMRPPQM